MIISLFYNDLLPLGGYFDLKFDEEMSLGIGYCCYKLILNLSNAPPDISYLEFFIAL